LAAIRDQGVGVLLVEQNSTMALSVASHAVVLELGAVRAQGAAGSDLTPAAVASMLMGGNSPDRTGRSR
jgi:branched-chain amino acid transport system ATP-binding protein